MNPGNLKMIVDLLQGMGADTKEAFIVWIVADRGCSVLLGLLCAISALLIVRMIVRAVRASQADENALCLMRDKLQIGHPGPIVDRERAETLAAVLRLVDKEKPKEG